MSCFLKGHLSRDLFLPCVSCQTQERFFFFLPSIMYLKSWNTKKTCRYCCRGRQSGGKCVNNWLHNHVNLFLTFWHFCQSKLSKCCSWSTNTKKYEKNQNAIGKYSNFYPSPPPTFLDSIKFNRTQLWRHVGLLSIMIFLIFCVIFPENVFYLVFFHAEYNLPYSETKLGPLWPDPAL